MFATCTPANISDDQGLIELLTLNIDYFKSKPSELPKTTILLDNGYHPDTIEKALVKVYPEIMSKIQFELSPKPSKAEKALVSLFIRTTDLGFLKSLCSKARFFDFVPARKIRDTNEKAEKGLSGFVPVKTRWVVERSNAWMERCKSLVKNFERTLAHATTKIHLCFLRLLLRRLAVS